MRMYFWFYLFFVFFLVLGLDAVDTSGDQHLQISHNIFKRRLDLSGQPIEEPKKTECKPNEQQDRIPNSLNEMKKTNFSIKL